MLIPYARLADTLKRTHFQTFLITGNEPLFVKEACDLVRRYVRKQGSDQREIIYLEKSQQTSWDAFHAANQSMSLFASSQLVEVRGEQFKPDKQGQQAILDAVANLTDNYLLFVFPAIDYQSRKAKWFQTLEKSGCLVINTQPLFDNQVRAWIQDRCKRFGLALASGAADIIEQRSEGNLLAADQMIRKLDILCPKDTLISEKDILDATEDSAKFDVYQLIDALLTGQTTKGLRILANLKSSGLGAPIIVWAFAKEARTLAGLCQCSESGNRWPDIFALHKIWKNRQDILRNAAMRSDSDFWQQELAELHQIDLMIKGESVGNLWDALISRCILWGSQLAGQQSSR